MNFKNSYDFAFSIYGSNILTTNDMRHGLMCVCAHLDLGNYVVLPERYNASNRVLETLRLWYQLLIDELQSSYIHTYIRNF